MKVTEATMTQAVRSASQFGTLIRNERVRRKLSQQELADLTGIGQKTISSVENGNEGAKLDTVFRLLAILGLEISFAPRDLGIGPGVSDVF